MSPSTLRALSTSTSVHQAAPGGGMMSNLQIVARRCPVMGKALAIQSAAHVGKLLGGVYGGSRAYHSRTTRAGLHTTPRQEARTIDIHPVNRDYGKFV